MIYWLALILGGIGILIAFWPSPKKEHRHYLMEANRTLFIETIDESKQAINLNALSNQNFLKKWKSKLNNVVRQIGQYAMVKLLGYLVFLISSSHIINQKILKIDGLIVTCILATIGLIVGYKWLQNRERRRFEEEFPDALSMLSSAVSSGESITYAIIYVGKTLKGEVGKEFKKMGGRLQVGEEIDSVFRKSIQRFPYPDFYFFVIALRANMKRGGQLKQVIKRLNRLMFDSRKMEKKKRVMTSEARISAKIVSFIPVGFMFFVQFTSPHNFDFLINDSAGKPILYYVITSELIGLGIVWALMKSVDK
ncbi:type II secretion system F family protein [Vibrio lentus]|uniref:type II secretion system F family protein n=1 Tax=Vibrio lentus TaxID=136468 RepID=UPI000C861255|nr:type II secretion system F family protein [Vibrio lentus]PMI79647.1 pilus assembly protein TadB [Vibrio lentus]